MKTSPTQRSLKMLRGAGFTVGTVERWNQHVGPHGIRQDFCGGIDLIAFRGSVAVPPRHDNSTGYMTEPCILGVQCCAGFGLAAHRTKLLAEPRMREWIAAGGLLVIHAWRTLSVVKRDGKKGKVRRYECNEVELTLADFPTGRAPEPCAAAPADR